MKRLAFCVVLAALFLLRLPAAAASQPAFHPSLSVGEGGEGDVVDLSLRYDGSLGEIGAFLVRVEFDPDAFEYLRATASLVLQDGYVTTKGWDSAVGSVYSLHGREKCLKEAGDTFTYRFRVKEGAEEGMAAFSVSVTQINSPEPKDLGHNTDETLTFTVLPPPSRDAWLNSLIPSEGELDPPFDPAVYQYRVTVPFTVREMTFQAEPAPGADCRVNRKNLGAGGSETAFRFTVTAEDGKTRQEYTVTVYREEQEVTPKPSATPRPASSPKPTASPKPGKTASPTKTPAPGKEKPASGSTGEKPGAPTVGTPAKAPAGDPAADSQEASPGNTAATSHTGMFPLTIRSGGRPVWPRYISVLLLVLALLFSKPLARWWCARFPEPEDPRPPTPPAEPELPAKPEPPAPEALKFPTEPELPAPERKKPPTGPAS